MSDLTTLRDHCRRMSTLIDLQLTPADRSLFAQIADEIDRYLTGEDAPVGPSEDQFDLLEGLA